MMEAESSKENVWKGALSEQAPNELPKKYW